MRSKINQFTDGAAPDGAPLISQQVHQQRDGRRTDPLDDLKDFQMQVFIATADGPSQHREGTPRPLDQGGRGGGGDLLVFVKQTTFPVKYQGGVSGVIQL